MAAYRADIEIGVRGVRSLEELRSSINLTARAVDSLNNVVGARGGLVQSVQNYANNLARAARSLETVGAGTQAETKAIREYVTALGQANAARARQNALVAQQIANQRQIRPGDAGFGQQGPALPPALIKTQEIRQSWNKFFLDVSELAQDLQQTAATKAANVQNSWAAFFREAADVASDLQQTAAAKTINLRNNWNTFFQDAAEVATELQQTAAAKTINLRNNWNKFFQDAAEVASDLQQTAAAKTINLRNNWNKFFQDAAEVATELQQAAAAKTINLRNNWNKFFQDAADLAQDLKSAAAAKALNIKTTWNKFFTDAADLAQDLQAAAAAKGVNIRTSWNKFFNDAGDLAQDLRSIAAAKQLNIRTSWNKFFSDAADYAADLSRSIPRGGGGGGGRGGGGGGGGGRGGGGGIKGMLQQPGVADALIGGSFPLLFGGGPGATIGGALGGLAGGAMGGPLGMALSLALSAVGQQLDAAIAKVVEMQKALNSLNIDALRDSFIRVNVELELTIRKLIDAGKYDEARLVAAQQLERQTGITRDTIAQSAQASINLNTIWTEVLGTISATVAVLSTPFIQALTKGLEILNRTVVAWNTLRLATSTASQVLFGSIIPGYNGLKLVIDSIKTRFGGITEEQAKLIVQLKLANSITERQITLTNQLNALQSRLTLGRTQAEKEINASINEQIAQKQINADFDIKAIELRNKYAAVSDEAGKKDIERALKLNEEKRNQALEEQAIKDRLVQQGLELEANAQKYEAVRQAINLQVEALDRANSVRQSALSLQSALNDLYGAQLEREYRLATTSEQRLQIALKQFQQQVNAARIEYEQAILNNKLLVDKAYLQTQLIKLRYEELAAEKEIAIAQAIARKNTDEEIAKIAAGYDRALGVQEQIVAAAEEQLGSTIEIAANQDGIAEAVYKTKVLSAEAALAQKLSTDEIGMSKKEADQLATYMSNVAQGAVETERQTRILNKTLSAGKRATDLMAEAMEGVASAASRAAIEIGKAVAKQRELNAARGGSPVTLAPAAEGAFWPGGFKAFAQGGVVNRPTMGLIGEGGESEYIVPESKAAGFATNYLFGQRGAAAIPDAGNTDGSAGTPVINITTGPVVEFNGQRYVTLADMERAMRITADSVIGKLRTPGSRIALGIS